MIMLLKKGCVKIDKDILENTAKGLETKLLMGDQLGMRLDKANKGI